MKNYFKQTTEKIPKAYQEQLAFPIGVKGKKVLANMYEGNAEIIDKVIAEITKKKDVNICDIGCGSADSIIKLDKVCQNCEIFGVDASPLSIKIAKENFAKYLENKTTTNKVSFLTSKSPNLSLKNNYFDIIILLNVIYFWEDLDVHLRNISNKIKPNGNLIVFFVDKQYLMNKVDLSSNIFHYHDLTDIENSLLKYSMKLVSHKEFRGQENQKRHIAIFQRL
jgi:ubiquinone/menaquinone biosynthesis C-methylase UbiE